MKDGLLSPTILDLRVNDATDALAELRAGLMQPDPAIEPKYFYDPLGANLFEAITRLPEYYLTRAEAQLTRLHGATIAAAIRGDIAAAGDAGAALVDLGAGSCAKAGAWFGSLPVRQYVAVDIALDFLAPALERLQRLHPRTTMLGVGCDFSRRLVLPPLEGMPVFLYPGSSIGNFAPAAARRFLAEVRAACGGGGLLIGVDLVKDAGVLERAYDDALGVTAAFNRNVLLHLNRLIDADFRVEDWRHRALYSTAESRIEMHLEAVRAVTVRWPGGGRTFAAGTRIHTENSYKWTPAAFAQLLHDSGFSRQRHWTDPDGQFAVFWAKA